MSESLLVFHDYLLVSHSSFFVSFETCRFHEGSLVLHVDFVVFLETCLAFHDVFHDVLVFHEGSLVTFRRPIKVS